MSVGIEFIIIGMLFHGAFAMAIGFLWSLLPKKIFGLAGFVLLYFAIAVWYVATFNFQMLIFSTYYILYVIVGLAGFALGTYLSRKGMIKISANNANAKAKILRRNIGNE